MTPGLEALAVLAARVEALTGPDRRTDYLIMTATAVPGKHYLWDPVDANHRYTASLDAAMTLVPEGDSFTIGQNVHHKHWVASVNYLGSDGAPHSRSNSYSNSSPALALSAASLRARAASLLTEEK